MVPPGFLFCLIQGKSHLCSSMPGASSHGGQILLLLLLLGGAIVVAIVALSSSGSSSVRGTARRDQEDQGLQSQSQSQPSRTEDYQTFRDIMAQQNINCPRAPPPPTCPAGETTYWTYYPAATSSPGPTPGPPPGPPCTRTPATDVYRINCVYYEADSSTQACTDFEDLVHAGVNVISLAFYQPPMWHDMYSKGCTHCGPRQTSYLPFSTDGHADLSTTIVDLPDLRYLVPSGTAWNATEVSQLAAIVQKWDLALQKVRKRGHVYIAFGGAAEGAPPSTAAWRQTFQTPIAATNFAHFLYHLHTQIMQTAGCLQYATLGFDLDIEDDSSDTQTNILANFGTFMTKLRAMLTPQQCPLQLDTFSLVYDAELGQDHWLFSIAQQYGPQGTQTHTNGYQYHGLMVDNSADTSSTTYMGWWSNKALAGVLPFTSRVCNFWHTLIKEPPAAPRIRKNTNLNDDGASKLLSWIKAHNVSVAWWSWQAASYLPQPGTRLGINDDMLKVCRDGGFLTNCPTQAENMKQSPVCSDNIPIPPPAPSTPGPAPTCDDASPACTGCLVSNAGNEKACAWPDACQAAQKGDFSRCVACTQWTPTCAPCAAQSLSARAGDPVCLPWTCTFASVQACTDKGGTVCGPMPSPCPPPPTFAPAAPGPHNTFPTLRSPPEKVLWGYWCQNSETGAVCSGKVVSQSSGGKNETDQAAIDMIIDSGINVLTLFCNIWQPQNNWGGTGSFRGGEGLPTGAWVDSFGTEGEHPLGGADTGKANMVQLQNAGVSVLLTIGSWDAIFPRAGHDNYIKRSDGTPGVPAPYTAEQVQQFCDTLSSMSEALGGVDGFDFDMEGFGAGPNPHKEGTWNDWCSAHAGWDGGPYPTSAQRTTITDYADLFIGNIPPGGGASDLGVSSPDDPTGCYSFPDDGTIQTLNAVFAELKQRNFIVTLVPMSTAMYTNDTTARQNQFIRHGINPQSIDGIMLQWYSGAGLDVCRTDDDKWLQCNEDAAKQCGVQNAEDDTNASRMQNLRNVIGQIPADVKAKAYWPTDDSIIISGQINGDTAKSEDYNKHNRCPFKCPRKIDCPDWSYEDDTTPFATQISVLHKISTWLDSNEKTKGQLSNKVVIGLEGFPNFANSVSIDGKATLVSTQFWGPVPSAQAIIGLDHFIRQSSSPDAAAVAPRGIAGVGIYTANTAFVASSLQHGGTDSIYHKLKQWKTMAATT